jgi:hypothetical protein
MTKFEAFQKAVQALKEYEDIAAKEDQAAAQKQYFQEIKQRKRKQTEAFSDALRNMNEEPRKKAIADSGFERGFTPKDENAFAQYYNKQLGLHLCFNNKVFYVSHSKHIIQPETDLNYLPVMLSGIVQKFSKTLKK